MNFMDYLQKLVIDIELQSVNGIEECFKTESAYKIDYISLNFPNKYLKK